MCQLQLTVKRDLSQNPALYPSPILFSISRMPPKNPRLAAAQGVSKRMHNERMKLAVAHAAKSVASSKASSSSIPGMKTSLAAALGGAKAPSAVPAKPSPSAPRAPVPPRPIRAPPAQPTNVPRSQLEEMQRKIAELEAYKTQREEQDKRPGRPPIEKPKGEPGRSGKNEKKPGYDLATAMEVSERHLEKIARELKFWMGKYGLPRGVSIDDTAYAELISKIYGEVARKFPDDFDNDHYPTLWPLRDILMLKLRNQRKNDADNARKRTRQEEADLAEREGRPISSPKKKKLAPKKVRDAEEQQSVEPRKPEESPVSSPNIGSTSPNLGASDAGAAADFDGGLEYTDADQSRVLRNQNLWALVGPVLRDAILDKMYDLPPDFAEYVSLSDEEKASWEARDSELAEELWGEDAGEPSRTWWQEALEERFADPDDFETIWEDFLDLYFDEYPDPRNDFCEEQEDEPIFQPKPTGVSLKRRIIDEEDDEEEQTEHPAKKEKIDPPQLPKAIENKEPVTSLPPTKPRPRPKPLKKRTDLEDDPIEGEKSTPEREMSPIVQNASGKAKGRAPPPSTRAPRVASKQK
ncbi:hypothetical protein DFP72DRAFT_1058343 [Ephemerocybe angulata]|uniref:Uncharacterized protein n=1 Tax=Ephemerocybe angulata TaxID=980116 RepID=A0A8H6IHH8_9AGAR|nr:hypothetical protein DFP72DRAFT_1058343 [Tulosesus angulatus]